MDMAKGFILGVTAVVALAAGAWGFSIIIKDDEKPATEETEV